MQEKDYAYHQSKQVNDLREGNKRWEEIEALSRENW
jgi:hypothetical protein